MHDVIRTAYHINRWQTQAYTVQRNYARTPDAGTLGSSSYPGITHIEKTMQNAYFGDEQPVESTQTRSIVPTTDHIIIEFNGRKVADTTRAKVVFESGLQPVYYVPPEDVAVEALALNDRTTVCPWKGIAQHYNLVVGNCISPTAAWCYPEASAEAAELRHYIAFYPHRIDRCIVNDLVVIGDPNTP